MTGEDGCLPAHLTNLGSAGKIKLTREAREANGKTLVLRGREVPVAGNGLLKHRMEPLWVSGKGLEGRTAMSFLPLNTEIIAPDQQGVVLSA